MTDLEITPDGLRQSGQRLTQVATGFAGALTAFQAELTGFGRPWGEDDIGSLIGAAHDEVESEAFDCYGSALDEIASAGDDVTAMAGAHTDTDTANGKQFTSLRDRL